MLSLLIDTHSSDMNVILYKDKLLCDSLSKTYNNQSKMLIPSVVNLLDKNDISLNDINEIIVVNGPGSFTGIRIGVTVAKTLSYSLDIPIKSISSLFLKAISVDESGNYSISMPDNKGFFVGEFENQLLKGNYFYIPKEEYEEYKNNHKVIENVVINWNRVFEIDCLTNEVCYNIKPLYIKKIEVEK